MDGLSWEKSLKKIGVLMATCTDCNSRCNCLVEEDGFYANRPADGRRNTIVTGSGSVSDPYVIEFMQSGEFRPPSGELYAENQTIPSASHLYIFDTIKNDKFVKVYESPPGTFLAVNNTTVITAIIHAKLSIVGASVSFHNNAVGVRKIGIISDDPTGVGTVLIAAAEQPGNAGRNSILTCSGFYPGFVDNIYNPNLSDPRVSAFSIVIAQESGGNLTMDKIKFWVTTI